MSDPDDPRLALAALAEEDHVVSGEQGVGELRHDRVLVADDAVEERLPGSQPGDDVVADLLLDRARLPPGGPQLADRRCSHRHHVGRYPAIGSA